MLNSSRRGVLRQSTAEAHTALDETIGAFSNTSDYGDYLRGLHAFRAAVDESMTGIEWPEAFGVLEYEPMADLIASDIADLDLHQAPALPPYPRPSGLEELVGLIYVLEGSNLGARLLYRRAQAIGLGGEFGARHLSRQTADTTRWPRFLSILEMLDDLDMDRVTASSIAAFGLARQAFETGAR